MTSLPADEQIRFCFSAAEMLEKLPFITLLALKINLPMSSTLKSCILRINKTQKEDNKMKRFVIPEHFKTYGVPLEDVRKKLPSPLITGAQSAPVLTWFSQYL